MQKKIITGLLALCFALMCVFGFSACGCKHENGTEKITRESTCIEAGEKEFTCSDCGKVIVSEIPLAEHDYSKEISNTATCTSSGSITYACSVCGKEKTEFSAALGHDYAGYFCSRCGKLEDGFNSYNFSGDMFDPGNLYASSLGSFIVLLSAKENSTAVDVTIFATGKVSGSVIWTVALVNNTKKTNEAFLNGIGRLKFNSLVSFSDESTMKNAYSSSDEYSIKFTVSRL